MNEEFYDLTQSGPQVQAILSKAASLPENPDVVIEGKIETAVSITYAALKALRDGAGLKAGQWYRITDFVTTVNPYTNQNARSAAHAFDVLVMALSASVLCEDAYAVLHSGDTYFASSKLEAWQLRYTIDNVQWSLKAGIYATDSEDYSFVKEGTIEVDGTTYILWKGDTMFSEDWADYAVSLDENVDSPMYAYYGPDDFDPENPEETGTIATVNTETNNGKGTILWMKDEFGNECAYDFKNIQYKRYLATDSVSGRDGLGGKYMVADPNNCPQGLSVEDTEDFIWAYTFSSDNAGDEQTDYSLTADHQVHDNVFRPYSGGLPNNVMFGEYNYGNSFGFDCYNNSWGNNCGGNSWGNGCTDNSWGNDCYSNSWGNGCTDNSWGNNCYYNSWGNSCSRNSWGNSNRYNSWGNNCGGNSWGNNCYNNSWGNDCYYNSWGNDCYSNSWGNNCGGNSWGNGCTDNSWGNNVTQTTLFEGVQYTQITTEDVKNVQVLNGVAGTSSSKLTLTFAANKIYTQVAAMTSAGALKIYVPGDLA